MKPYRLLVSLFIVGIVASLGFIATQAYFSDAETSLNNTFQSGSLNLSIGSQCSYNGSASAACGTWSLKNLNPTSDHFFTFDSLRPGDWGENTIAFRIDQSDAYFCLGIGNMASDDLGLTAPEAKVDTTDGSGNGELAEELTFFAWADDGDNIWETNEPKLFTNTVGSASDVLNGKVYSLYTPTLGSLFANTTKYIAIEWCYGTLIADENTHTLSCSGQGTTNRSQTDKVTADVVFYAEQAANNSSFACPTIQTLLGQSACIPSSELCNGLDDDCDGQIDEDYPTVGSACAASPNQCVDGVYVCNQTGTGVMCNGNPTPPTEFCDGLDNNCDGRTDEGFDAGMSCSVGVGACHRMGTKVCSVDHQSSFCNATAGTPATELCGNGQDDDCDGQTDEGFNVGASCSVGIGACLRTGNVVCSSDGQGSSCNAVAGIPVTEICGNGQDDNCDGQTDEGCN